LNSAPKKSVNTSANSAAAANGGARENDAVLIISDDPEFARAVVGRWQSDPVVPAFTLFGSQLPAGALSAVYGLAILDPAASKKSALLQALEGARVPVICVIADGQSAAFHSSYPRTLSVPKIDGWLDAAVQLATEVLRRTKAEGRAALAQQAVAENGCHATVGRYVLEMRHTLNNCLTSVLGNSELLLLEPGALTSVAREQVETIHMMAMRIHEVLQRLSSLELEMQFAQKESHSETRLVSHRAAAGD